MAYLGEFDFYFKDGSHLEPSAENIRKFNLVSFESEDLIKSIVEEGIKDGSIKPNINVDLTVATISSVLWGFGQRIAIRGHILESETGFDAIELIKNQIEIYIMALRRN